MTHSPQSTPTPRTALVLGGGGSSGNAWLIGILAGLFEAGLDVTTADVTIGTSSGATTAAQLAGATPPELFAATVAPLSPQRTGPAGSGRGGAPTTSFEDHLEKMRGIIAASENAADWRRRMGAMALETDAASGGAWQERWRATVASRLPGAQWPERRMLITAVDASNGGPVAFDRRSGVELVDAVAASTAGGGFGYGIGGGLFIDGGYRSNAENADLATGYDRVLVLSPLFGRSLTPPEWGVHLATQIEELRDRGSRVKVIFPERADAHLFGANAMDYSLRPAAARAGHDHGTVLAEELTGFWG